MSSLTITRLENGIVAAEYPRHVALTETILEEEFAVLQRFSDEPICYLVKLRGVAFIDKHITDYISERYTSSRFKAVAILFNADYGYFEHGKMLIDAFLHLTEISFPVSKFENEEQAIEWLSSYL